jgi:hypothetical protein
LTVLTAYFEKNMKVAEICECFGIAVSTLYSWKERLLEHKELLLGILESQKESAITFLRNMSNAACLSDYLRSFFHRYAFSFMQCRPQQRHGAAHSNLASPRPFPPPHTIEMDYCPCL